MTKTESKKILKQAFLDAYNNAMNTTLTIRQNSGVYTPEMLRALCEMAKNDVYPDWRFGDIDCNVWSMFRECVNKF